MTMKLHIAGIGSRYNSIFAPSLEKLVRENRVEIGYIFSRDLEKAALVAKTLKCGSPVHYLNYKNLLSSLDKKSTNVILVNLPNNVKFAIITHALKHNIFVYTEAPLARKIYEAEQFKRTINNCMLCVGEDLRFSLHFRKLREKVMCNMTNPTVFNTGYGFSHHLASTITSFQHQAFVKIKDHFITRIKTQSLIMFVHYGKLNNGNNFVFFTLDPKNNPLRNITDVILYDGQQAESLKSLKIQHKENDLKYDQIESIKMPKGTNIKEHKFYGQIYNFMNFLTCIESNKLNKVEYKFSSSYSDFYISKQIFARQKLHFLPKIIFNLVFFLLKYLRKV